MNKVKMMTLYICSSCDILLIRPDVKESTYNSTKLNELGEYESLRDGDCYFEYYQCPRCGLCSEGDLNTGNEVYFKKIVIPISVAKALIKLWNSLDKKDEVRYGIPLDNPDLKGLLVEELL